QNTFTHHTDFKNFGTVTGVAHGVLLHNASTVSNQGIIQAIGGAGSIGVQLLTRAGDIATLTNSGTIAGGAALQGGAGREVILNTGRLEGDVSLLAGNDTFDTRGGVVVGAVDLGSGDDTAYGGALADRLFG